MARTASPTRRELLAAGAAAGALALLPGCGSASSADRRQARVVIVGAGIAGLTAALVLRDAGVRATVYEASDRVGGRMHTSYDGWGDGRHVELCGEFVDSDHTTIRRLVRRFRLDLTDLGADEPAGSHETYRVGGEAIAADELRRELLHIVPALRRDARAAGDVTWRHASGAGRALDRMTVAEWIARNVPDGPLRPLLAAVFTAEYAADPQDLSALNIVWDLARRQPRQGVRFFDSDERYTITQGSQALPQAIARKVGHVRLNQPMTGLAQNRREVILGIGREEVRADRVILALPFASLRELDLADAGFDARKRRAIDTLGRGRSTKLAMRFDGRPWDAGGGNGTILTDAPFTTTWDATRGQPGPAAVLTALAGGARAARLAANPDRVADTLAQLDAAIPGVSADFSGHAELSAPPLSYSYVAPGQFSTIHGYERVRQSRVHFAGEHCSVEYQGSMEGAAREGARAAREVLRRLG